MSTSTCGATWVHPAPGWSPGSWTTPAARTAGPGRDCWTWSRAGAAYGDWLTEQGPAFTSGIRTATLDPFHGYANAIRDELPEAIIVLDAFHVVKLGGQVVDEVRRRVQQDTLGHRGRAGDPLYGIRRTLQIGAEHLTAKQITRLNTKLEAGDPHHEVTLAWHCYQKLRAISGIGQDGKAARISATSRRPVSGRAW